MIAPQVHEGDHETTAENLHTDSRESLAVALLRLFIYVETNDMVLGWLVPSHFEGSQSVNALRDYRISLEEEYEFLQAKFDDMKHGFGADLSYLWYFNWGIWDDELFSLYSGQL